MPEAIPHMDYEMLARYEWFRRSFWGQSEQAWLIPIFHALVREHGCASCLFACGALGRVALAFAKQSPGTALFAYLPSAYGAERMRELAKAEGVSCSFLFGNRAEIAGNLPHPVDCVFSPNWMSEPDWNVLKTYFESAFAALNPGGILAFPAPRPGGTGQRLLYKYDSWDDDALVWNYRDGAKECLCLRSKVKRADNYADIKYTFIAVNRDDSSVETTAKRLPAYWSWDIAKGLASDAGFCECEACGLDQDGSGDGMSVVMVARKPGAKKAPSDGNGQLSAYADF